MPGIPFASPLDISVEGLASAGTQLYYGSRSRVVVPASGSLAFRIVVRRRNDFAQTLGAPLAARRKHTATRLQDGTVLIAGGENPATGEPLASAEIFDPENATFEATGSLRNARAEHAAVPLASGRVVLAGGVAGGGYPLAVEIYDPAKRAFEEAGNLTAERAGLTATGYLKGGAERVLFAGGRGPSAPQDSVDLYDPAARSVGSPKRMSVARAGHAAAEIPSGVLIVGGHASETAGEIFRAADETFSVTAGPMSAPRPRASLTVTDIGRILVAGSVAALDAYDTGLRTFTSVTSLATARADVGLAPLPGDRVLVAGGGSDASPVAEAQILIGTSLESSERPLDHARAGHTLTALADGTVLAVGGTAERVAEVFLPR
jgi:hypothetical protein